MWEVPMERAKILIFLFSAALIVLMPNTQGQPHQRPLCVSQFSLVNYACASLPNPLPGPVPIPSLPSPDDGDDSGGEVDSDDKHQNEHGDRHEAGHGGRHEQRHSGHVHRHEQGHRDQHETGHGGRHEGHGRHERGHGDSHGDGDGDQHEHRHGHRHGHRHRHRHRKGPLFPVPPNYESPAVENCCRWLKELDDECVCDLLIHLPPFLSKPAHDYTIRVGQSCDITYHC